MDIFHLDNIYKSNSQVLLLIINKFTCVFLQSHKNISFPARAFIYKLLNFILYMAVEVFNNIGESEIYSDNSNSYGRNRYRKKDDEFEESETTDKIESKSPISDEKKEFLESLGNDSLSVDTCINLNRNWKDRKN